MADAFSLIQFKDLPTFTGTLSENATLVAVLDNVRTVRIDWDILNSGLIRGSADQPSSPSDLGEQGNLYVGSTGLYSYSDGAWGKSPRYTENWDDLVPGVRFLRVDGSQSLSSTEKSQVLANVGLTVASAGGAGLVKAWGDATSELTGGAPVIINPDGTQYVAEATATSLGVVNLTDVATRTYVTEAIADSIVAPEELPIATSEVAGVVLSDAPLENGDGVFSVGVNGKVTIRPASLYILEETEEGNEVGKGGLPGIYSVTDADDGQASLYAPTLRLVKELLDSAGELNEVPVATTAYVGGVKAWPADSSPEDDAKVIINSSGLQYVPKAESNVTGTVRVVTTGDAVTDEVDSASSFTVPTVGAVYSFVSTNFLKLNGGKVSVSALPLATGSTVGAIKGSSTVNIDIYGEASVPDAAVDSKGVVTLAELNEVTGEFVANAGVTTAYQVEAYVTSKLTAGDLAGVYVSKTVYDSHVANTTIIITGLQQTDADLRQDITGVGNSLKTLSSRVGTVESDVDALQQAQGSEVLLNVDSTTVTAATGWVKYTGQENSTVIFSGEAPTGYVSTLTFQTEVPVTFGGTILWDNDETPSLLAGTGYVFQITSFPGSNVKLGRKVMEYTPQSST